MLLSEQNDNNVKLIIITKICALKRRYARLLEEQLIEIMNLLNESTSID